MIVKYMYMLTVINCYITTTHSSNSNCSISQPHSEQTRGEKKFWMMRKNCSGTWCVWIFMVLTCSIDEGKEISITMCFVNSDV